MKYETSDLSFFRQRTPSCSNPEVGISVFGGCGGGAMCDESDRYRQTADYRRIDAVFSGACKSHSKIEPDDGVK